MSLLPGTFEGMGLDPLDMNHARRANQTRGGTAALDPTNIAALAPWQDAALALSNRSLDPQWQQAEARFNQDMVNRGIAQGSEAYTAARGDFDRGRNDAYSGARNQALAQALAAQQQGFGQSFGLDQLASQNAATNAQRAGAAMQDAWNRERFNREFGEDTRRWDLSRGDQLGQQDFNNMMGMLDFDRGTNNMNNGYDYQDFQQNAGLMGFTPNANPYTSNTYAPYQIQGQNEANRSQAAGQQSSNTMSTVGNVIGGVAMAVAL